MRRVLVVVLLWAGMAWGEELVFIIESPPTTPPPESYLFTAFSSVNPQAPEQFRIANGGRASCDSLREATSLPPEAVCGLAPACLPPGVYTFWVQAELGGQASAASNLVTCEALAGCRYDCEGLALPPALQGALTYDAAGTPRLDMEKAQAAVAVPDPGPPVASVTTPAPTVEAMTDGVQAALARLPPPMV